jgi:hypothetical protein
VQAEARKKAGMRIRRMIGTSPQHHHNVDIQPPRTPNTLSPSPYSRKIIHDPPTSLSLATTTSRPRTFRSKSTHHPSPHPARRRRLESVQILGSGVVGEGEGGMFLLRFPACTFRESLSDWCHCRHDGDLPGTLTASLHILTTPHQ